MYSLKHVRYNHMLQCIFSIVFIGIFFLPVEAHAQITLQQCAKNSGYPTESLTGPIVYCIESSVENAVGVALGVMTSYFQTATWAAMILAVIIHGAHMLAGERGMSGKGMTLILKLAFVAFFITNMGTIAGDIFAIMNEIMDWSGNGNPWTNIDNILASVCGFAPGVALSQGLLWLATAAANGTASIGMSSALIVAFIEFILFIIEIVYVFLSAYLIVAFMIIMSPMFIPMMVFQATDRYFRKWYEVIIGAMLVPFMICVVLSFALGLYGGLICNVVNIMLPDYKNCAVPTDPNNPPDYRPFFKTDVALHSLTTGIDPNFTLNVDNQALSTQGGTEKDTPSASVVVNPYNRGGFDTNPLHPPLINFGRHDKKISGALMYAFITLWIYTMILKRLIEAMPEVAQEIAGVSLGLALRGPKLSEKISEIKNDLVGGGGMVAGAIAGRRTAALAGGGKHASEASTIAGGILGDVLARKAIK